MARYPILPGVSAMRASYSLFFSSVLWVLLFFTAACSTPEEEAVVPPANEATVADTLAGDLVYVVFGHEVKDYDIWKKTHADLTATREAWGITDSYIMQGADEDSVVWMISTAPDEEAAHEFMVDPNLARAMEAAGVEGEVYRAILAPGFVNSFDPNDFPNRIIVQHGVRDFDAWKAVFDGHVGSRERAGLVDLFVSHPVGDSTDVHMMFGVLDESSLTDYMSSPALRVAMRLSGVIGEPKAYFVRVAD